MSHDDVSPLVIWETSQASDPACPHCRASAAPRWHSSELTTAEGIRLLDQIGSFGSPSIVFTGSDPLVRPDLFLLIRKSVALGLPTTVSPGAAAFLSCEAIREFKKEGVARMAIRMDDAIVPPFDFGMQALHEASRIGLETQVQTIVTRWNMYELDEIADRVEMGGARVWSLFLDDLTSEELKEVFEDLYRISRRVACDVRATERTYRHQNPSVGSADHHDVADARGFVFISHTGEIHPSGFLAVSVGNVCCDSLPEVYRNSSLFNLLRDADRGECRACELRGACSGLRARAYALTGREATT